MTVSGTGVAISRSVLRKRVSIAVAAACGACAGSPRDVQRFREVHVLVSDKRAMLSWGYLRLREEVKT
jgi:hypothetical protein